MRNLTVFPHQPPSSLLHLTLHCDWQLLSHPPVIFMMECMVSKCKLSSQPFHVQVSIGHMVLSVQSKHLPCEKDALHQSFPLTTDLKGHVHEGLSHTRHIPEFQKFVARRQKMSIKMNHVPFACTRIYIPGFFWESWSHITLKNKVLYNFLNVYHKVNVSL